MCKKIAAIVAALYFICMFAWPIAAYRDWERIQVVWDRWQALNVGLLAFFASVIFWYTAHFRSKENDVKEYKTARVFLVFVASELCREFDKAAALLKEKLSSKSLQAIDGERFTFPQHLSPYLERYIKYTDPENAQYIIDLIKIYQVYTDRLNTVLDDISDRADLENSIKDSIGDLFNISARTNRLFGYGRGINSLDTSRIKSEEVEAGLSRYGFLVHSYSISFTGDFLEKHSGDIFEKKKVGKS